MRRKRPPAPTPATRPNDLSLPTLTAAVRGLLGYDSTVRPLWNYDTGALEAVEVRTQRPITQIPGILDQLSTSVTTRLREPWICDRHTDDPATIRIAKADQAALTQAGVNTIRSTLVSGAASLGNPQITPTYQPDGDLEAIEISFSPGRKVGDHVLSDFTTRVMPGEWIPSWTGPDTLCLTPRA
jgi:hypothetical protein